MFSDLIMRTSSITLAEQKVTAGVAPVFMYLLTWESPAKDGFLGASHGLCVPLSMDNRESCPAVGDYPSSRQVADDMSEAWLAFAREGDPNHPDIPKWPTYSVDRRTTMIFDEHCKIVDDPFREQRLAWQD
jgi:para-nitrobenzyl esterase